MVSLHFTVNHFTYITSCPKLCDPIDNTTAATLAQHLLSGIFASFIFNCCFMFSSCFTEHAVMQKINRSFKYYRINTSLNWLHCSAPKMQKDISLSYRRQFLLTLVWESICFGLWELKTFIWAWWRFFPLYNILLSSAPSYCILSVSVEATIPFWTPYLPPIIYQVITSLSDALNVVKTKLPSLLPH